MTDKIEFPKTLSVFLPDDKKVSPFSGKITPKLMKSLTGLAIQGVLNKDGTWRQRPNLSWVCVKQGDGIYKVVHNLNYRNTTLSVFLLQSPGSFEVIEHHIDYFVVRTILDGIDTDMDFGYNISPVVG